MTSVFEVTLAKLFLVLGVITLFQAVLGFLKGDSTKSIIPIFEQVANYENQKMGIEWQKQRKVGYISNLVISMFMFLQVYLNRNSMDKVLQMDFDFILMLVFLIAIVNFHLILHARMIDRTPEFDKEEYTRKSIFMGLAMGTAFVLTVFVFGILFMPLTMK